MNIKDLEYFQVICQEKSINRAAKRMYLSPQGMIRILQNMENELNTTLLIRTKSGIRLTESGDALLMHAGEILGIGGLANSGMHEIGRMMFGVDKMATGQIVRTIYSVME